MADRAPSSPAVRCFSRLVLAGLLPAAIAITAVGCSGSGTDEAAEPAALPSSSCSPIEYGGSGQPDYLIASDLPLQGPASAHSRQINDAIRYRLKQISYRAGAHSIGFQACDDATPAAGGWDAGKCRQNADAYSGNVRLIGIVGTFNSACAGIVIGAVNASPEGPIPVISPANTLVCLTQADPGCDQTEPDKYYPTGTRNYVRVSVPDSLQGAADAELARSLGVKSVYILNDAEAYGVGLATNFRAAADSLGIRTAGFEPWDPKAVSYEPLFQRIKRSGADAVFLGGVLDQNGARLIKDKVAVLGPNDRVRLLAPDGFLTQRTIDEAGPASKDMLISAVGQPIGAFNPKARRFAKNFAAAYLSGKAVDPFAIYGAQTADVLLTAISESDGSRADVIRKMFGYRNAGSYLGPIRFDADGDIVGRGAYGITISRVGDGLETETVIYPHQATIDAANAAVRGA